MTVFTANAIVLIIAALPSVHAWAAEDQSDSIRRAYELKLHGDFTGAIAILAPIANSPSDLSDQEKGTVWKMLGSAYQVTDNFTRAQSCYEKAIAILRRVPSAQAELASAIDDLGSLEEILRHSAESERLRQNAKKMYAALDDHAGVARVSTSLAIIAMQRDDRSAARSYLGQALQEAQLAKGLDDDDTASMLSVQGWLALKDKKPQSALLLFEGAIAHWTRLHGAMSCQVAAGLVLRAQAYEENENFIDALADLHNAENIFATTLGKNSTVYWNAVLHQAIVMKHYGHERETRSLQKTATNALSNIARESCVNCTITAEAFR